MKIKTELLKADGYCDQDIQTIQDYVDAAEADGRFSHAAAVVDFNGTPQFCCRTIAEIMDEVRPGCWLDKP